MRSLYQFIFVPVLLAALLLVGGFAALYAPALFQHTNDPPVAAGAAQIADTSTPAQDQAAVTTDRPALTDAEEARNLPQGQPEAIPAGSPKRAGQDNP